MPGGFETAGHPETIRINNALAPIQHDGVGKGQNKTPKKETLSQKSHLYY